VKRLADRRILIVGASSGIGRAIAEEASREGARVAIAARRAEQLKEIAEDLSSGALAVPLDVRDPEACANGTARAVEGLGGLDDLVYAVGTAYLHSLADVDAEAWRESFEVNVSGAALITRAALPHLAESRGRAVYVSSISADDSPPRRGLGPYMVTKAALNKLVEVWQAENHSVGFTRVSVGDTGATEFGKGWDPEATGDRVREWIDQGVMFGRAMEPGAVGRHVIDLLASEECVAASRLVPRYLADDEAEPWQG
jgi:NAD(P)-dependent dehydrogenase (short-subunit alcohol dehydrogenase family)